MLNLSFCYYQFIHIGYNLKAKDIIMTELNKTDAKYLSLVKPIIKDIQGYVDENICNGRAMTAAAIYEGFKNKIGCELNVEDFVKGFRIAVRVGEITGIEGAKRLGYRQIGTETKTNSSNDVALENVDSYLESIQAFIDKYIQGDVRMTASVIYKRFKTEAGCELSEDDFIKSFRIAIKEDKITGLESAYRFGYKRAGTFIKHEDDDENTESDSCEIVIDERRKVIALDRLNWAYQVRKDSGAWTTEAYFGSYHTAISGVARKLLDDEIRHLDRFSIEYIIDRVNEAESNIMDLLQKVLNPEVSTETKAV